MNENELRCLQYLFLSVWRFPFFADLLFTVEYFYQ